MADIEKISVSGTSYDVRDASAAHELTDIAQAGTGIEFQTAQTAYTIEGSCTVDSNYIASNFSDSSYVLATQSIPANTTNWEFAAKIHTKSSISGSSYIAKSVESGTFALGIYNGGNGTNFGNGSSWFSTPLTIIDSTIATNTDYWYRVTFNGTKYSIERSTDGMNYTEIAYMTNSNPIGKATLNLGVGSGSLADTLDLKETYIKVNGTEIWRAVTFPDKTIISSTGGTVDQTYSSSSANAQSGVAIAGAGFLNNTATGYGSITIGGIADTSGYSVNVGSSSTTGGYSASFGYNCNSNYHGTAVGSCASAGGQYSVAIGGGSYKTGAIQNNTVASANYSVSVGSKSRAIQDGAIAIGYYAQANGTQTIAIGTATNKAYSTTASGNGAIAVGNMANASGNMSMALGYSATASAYYAIQIGQGTNNTANTLSVGLSGSNNYQLLDSSGHIPGPRMALQGAAAPDTSTVGSVGQFYVDTTNQDAYICVSDASSTYTWKKITP